MRRVPPGEDVAPVQLAIADALELLANGGDDFSHGGTFIGAGQIADILTGDRQRLYEQAVDLANGAVRRTKRHIRKLQIGAEAVLPVERLAQIHGSCGGNGIFAGRQETPPRRDPTLGAENLHLVAPQRVGCEVNSHPLAYSGQLNRLDRHNVVPYRTSSTNSANRSSTTRI